MVKIRKISNKTDVEMDVVEENVAPPKKRSSEDPIPQKTKWINKQRVLVFASRGINYRHRHLMEDIKKLMPHHKTESKMERSKNLFVVNEICEVKNCNKAILFEGRRKADLYMWLSNIVQGPSVKFLIENVYTMDEMKLTGNCLRGSRPLLSFSTTFSKEPHYILMKELITQIFGVPNHHPKSQPFFDRVYSFNIMDNRIWFRHYQILSEDGALVEIGPRFVMNPVKVFDGSFGGQPLWENPHYMSPAKYRQVLKQKASNKYIDRVEQKAAYAASRPKTSYNLNNLDDIFVGDIKETAKKIKESSNDAENKLNDDYKSLEPSPKKSKIKPEEENVLPVVGGTIQKDSDVMENSEAGSFVRVKKLTANIKNKSNKKLRRNESITKAKPKKLGVKFMAKKLKSLN